jgi:hypothetical protein
MPDNPTVQITVGDQMWVAPVPVGNTQFSKMDGIWQFWGTEFNKTCLEWTPVERAAPRKVAAESCLWFEEEAILQEGLLEMGCESEREGHSIDHAVLDGFSAARDRAKESAATWREIWRACR